MRHKKRQRKVMTRLNIIKNCHYTLPIGRRRRGQSHPFLYWRDICRDLRLAQPNNNPLNEKDDDDDDNNVRLSIGFLSIEHVDVTLVSPFHCRVCVCVFPFIALTACYG